MIVPILFFCGTGVGILCIFCVVSSFIAFEKVDYGDIFVVFSMLLFLVAAILFGTGGGIESDHHQNTYERACKQQGGYVVHGWCAKGPELKVILNK